MDIKLEHSPSANAVIVATAHELLEVAIKSKSFMDERMDSKNPFDVAFYKELCIAIDKASI